MKVLVFNTGRTYSANGQRIGAVALNDETVAFVDRDRGLDGVIRFCDLNQYSIMRAYDSPGWSDVSLYEVTRDLGIDRLKLLDEINKAILAKFPDKD